MNTHSVLLCLVVCFVVACSLALSEGPASARSFRDAQKITIHEEQEAQRMVEAKTRKIKYKPTAYFDVERDLDKYPEHPHLSEQRQHLTKYYDLETPKSRSSVARDTEYQYDFSNRNYEW